MARKIAAALVAAFLAVALLADFVASDRPIVLHYEGETYWFPNLIEYDALDELRGDALARAMTSDDWALWPPVRHGPTAVRTDGELAITAAPSGEHWLGTDDRGRDVLARLVHGTRAAAITAAGAALLALAAAIVLALVAVRFGGAVDAVVIAGCDAVAAVPALLLVVAARGLIGGAGLAAAVVLIALPRAGDTARLARAAMRTALEAPFCDAARALGATRGGVLVRHALPQARDQLAVATAITAATAILSEAALSFLGFGVAPPAASWGELLAQAHANDLRWWLAIPAGACIAVVAAALGALAQPRR